MMTYIEVPNENDSVSRVMLDGKEYLIRFTYNAAYDYWSFSLYEKEQPILLMLKIVPVSPLTHFYTDAALPKGIFGAFTNLPRIGRNDFVDGKADFAYIPAADLEGWEAEDIV